MVIVHLSGGFGNQLFSYAFGFAVAKARNEELIIDTAIQDAPWFFRNPDIMKMHITYDRRVTYPIKRNVIARVIFNKVWFRHSIGWKTKIVTEKDFQGITERLKYVKNIQGNIYLKGNWQSESWFETVADEIREKFEFINTLSKGAQVIAEQITQQENAVTIHVRRGDYVTIGVALQPQFYINAMNEIAKKINTPVFYCFSEDLEWAKNAFKDVPYQIIYPMYESDDKGIEDFRLLSLGKHQILSNSSYSWWSAYLNKNQEKMVVIPINEEDDLWNNEFKANGWIPMRFEKIAEAQN